MQTPDSSATGLPSTLSAALGCLDVTLEDELALYRNQKNVKLLALSGHEAPLEEEYRADRTPELVEEAVPSLGIQDDLDQDLEYQEPEVVYAELEAGFEPNQGQPIAMDGNGEQPLSKVKDEAAIDPTPVQTNAIDQQEMEQALTHVKPHDPTPPEAPLPADQLPTPYGVEGNPLPESFEKFLDPSINDYLESSEGLLKHMEYSAEDTEQRVQQSTQKSWKIASLLGLAAGLLLSAIWLISGYFKPPAPPLEVPQQPLSPSPTPVEVPTASPSPPTAAPPAASPLAPPSTPIPTAPEGTTAAPTTPPDAAPTVIPSPPLQESPAPTSSPS